MLESLRIYDSSSAKETSKLLPRTEAFVLLAVGHVASELSFLGLRDEMY